MWAGCAASVRVMEPSAHPGTEQSFTAHGKKTDLNRPTVSDGRTWNSYLMRRDWTQGNKIFFCFMSLTSTWPWNPLVVEDLISSDADRGSILSFFYSFLTENARKQMYFTVLHRQRRHLCRHLVDLQLKQSAEWQKINTLKQF